MRKLVTEKVNASKIKTRVILPLEGSVLLLSTGIVRHEKRPLFLPQHAGMAGSQVGLYWEQEHLVAGRLYGRGSWVYFLA